MKLFKKIFGSKPKKISKYGSNTLAEINESPDWNALRDKEEDDTQEKTVAAEKKAARPEPKAVKSTASKAVKPSGSTAKKAAKNTGTKSSATGGSSTDSKSESGNKSAPKTDDSRTTTAAKSKEKVAKADTKADKTVLEESRQNADTDEGAKEAKSSDSTSKSTKPGKFEIKKSKDGRYVFNLYASNNVIVATSQVYSSSTAAMNGIKSVIANASSAPVEDQTLKTVTAVPFPKWEIYRDKGDQYRFRLCASNGSCVCHSQGYTSKANCKKGIESIIKSATGAEITKAYLNNSK